MHEHASGHFRRSVGAAASSAPRLLISRSGPNWIHGTAENPIVPLAERAGSALHAFEQSSPVYDSAGRELPAAEAGALMEQLWETVDAATEYSKAHKAEIPAERSLHDFAVERAPVEASRRRTWLQMVQMWGAFIGTAVERQSLKYFLLEEPVEGRKYSFPWSSGTVD